MAGKSGPNDPAGHEPDKVTIADIEEQGVEDFVEAIHAELREGE